MIEKLIENILNDSLSSIRKYLDDEGIDKSIIELFDDPSNNLKYIDWMVRQKLEGHDVDDIQNVINKYHDRKDISVELRDTSFDELRDMVGHKSRSGVKNSLIRKGIDGLELNKDYMKLTDDAYIPLNKYSAMYITKYLCKNIRWCTTYNDGFIWDLYTKNDEVFVYVLGDIIEGISIGINTEKRYMEIGVFDENNKPIPKSQVLSKEFLESKRDILTKASEIIKHNNKIMKNTKDNI